MDYHSYSANDTINYARELGETAKAGDIFCLNGDLGAGKTVFSKGFALGLGVSQSVSSPTFVIMNQYQGRLPMYHFDLYRITSPEEMLDLDYEEFFFGDGVCLIEWAENVRQLIPSTAKWIEIAKDLSKGEDYRRIVQGFGE